MKTKRLIFIRHAETYHSKKKLYQTDTSPILPVPKEVTKELVKVLGKLKPRFVLVSDLARSKQTADLLNIPTKIQPLLNEFREPSNLASNKISASNSYIFKVIEIYDKDPSYQEEDGESLKSIINRIIKLRRLLEKNDEPLMVCAGHGFYIRLFALLTFVETIDINSNMLSSLVNTRLEKLNCASFIFEQNKWSLESWNVSLNSLH